MQLCISVLHLLIKCKNPTGEEGIMATISLSYGALREVKLFSYEREVTLIQRRVI